MNWADWITRISLFTATLGQTAYVVIWSRRNPYANYVTKALLRKGIILALLLWLVSIRLLVSSLGYDPPWWDQVFAVAYALFAFAVLRQVAALFRVVYSERKPGTPRRRLSLKFRRSLP